MVQISKIQINTNYHIYYHPNNRIVKLITIETRTYTSTARGEHAYQHDIDLETPVWVELFIAVELPSKCVQVPVTVHKILHADVRGTKRVREAVRRR